MKYISLFLLSIITTACLRDFVPQLNSPAQYYVPELEQCIQNCLLVAPEVFPPPTQEAMEKSCRTQCSAERAISEKDESYCNKLDDVSRQTCYHQFAIATNQHTFCEKGNNPKNCYRDIAIASNNADLCNNAGDFQEQSSCYYVIAHQSNVPEFCEKAGDHRNKCYKFIAEQIDDADLCRKIEPNTQWYSDCYRSVAIKTNNALLCAQLIDPTWCYYDIAVAAEDLAICESIERESIRKACSAKISR